MGILVGIKLPNPAVLLQVRASHDSYAGACQVTTHGKLTNEELQLDQNDALNQALRRKLKDELGESAERLISARMQHAIDLTSEVNNDGRLIVTRGLALEDGSELKKLIIPGKDVGGFLECTDPEQILPLESTHKQSGVRKGEIRMFKDEILAVKEFFKRMFH